MVYTGVDIADGHLKKLSVENGKVIGVVDEGLPQGDIQVPFLSNTFLDLQVNGYKGVDYSGENLTTEGIRQIVNDLAARGTCRHVPTIITNSQDRIIQNINIIVKAREDDPIIFHAIPAIHVEGPFISHLDGPRGAHDPLFVRNPNLDEFNRWFEASKGLLKIITIAPETEGSTELIRHAKSLGVKVAIGHCQPSERQLQDAIDAGASISTHLGNGSSSMLPRLRNHIWQQLADDSLAAGVIADGYHIPPYVLKCFSRVKGIHNVFLVSDVAYLGGYPAGMYTWGNIDVEVFSDGHLGLPGTDLLAGAGHLLDRCVACYLKSTGMPLVDVLKTVTCNPSKILNVAGQHTGFSVGDSADILVFKFEKDQLMVQSWCFGTYIGENEK